MKIYLIDETKKVWFESSGRRIILQPAQNMITMSKIIKNQIPREPREFKPVETMKFVVDESGRLQPKDCN